MGHPQNQFVNNNDNAAFECFVNGSDSLNITWEKDRKLYTLGDTNVTTYSNGVSSSLTLNRATVADSGKYRCNATNVDGKSATSYEAELLSKYLIGRPEIIVLCLQLSHKSSSTLMILLYLLAAQHRSLVVH